MSSYLAPSDTKQGRSATLLMTALLVLSLSLLYLLPVSESTLDSSRGVSTSASKADEGKRAEINKAYGKLPIFFVPNKGQADKRVEYYAKGAGYSFYLTQEGVTYAFSQYKSKSEKEHIAQDKKTELSQAKSEKTYILKLKFLGASPQSHPLWRGKAARKSKLFYRQ